MQDNRIKVDMHIHSCYSGDSSLSIEDIAAVAQKSRIYPIICDHDSVRGSQEITKCFKKLKIPFPAILAEEISTSDGEIVGIFLSDEIPSGHSAAETCELIKDQGGLCIVPHPFDRFRKKTLRREVLDEIATMIDIIEGYNARVLLSRDNRNARDFAANTKKPVSIGSDAHSRRELGKCYGSLDEFDSAKTFLKSLKSMSIHFKKANPGVHLVTKIRKLR
jgi:predicted metal-dependent phosphoesterase TrpH